MRRRWRDALTAFEEMQRMHVRPDVLTYNALITALANGREYDRALQVGFLPPLLELLLQLPRHPPTNRTLSALRPHRRAVGSARVFC